jgi:hypothetical protein
MCWNREFVHQVGRKKTICMEVCLWLMKIRNDARVGSCVWQLCLVSDSFQTMKAFNKRNLAHGCLWYLYSYWLTPRCRVLLEKLTGLQLVKKFPAFHGTPRFITALTSVRHLSLSWASPISLCMLRDVSPTNTPPSGDPSVGVVS